MWFDSWADLVPVVFVGGAAYILLILLVRLSGKRSLSQLNAFDFIVTVALGSILATTLLTADVSLAEGVTALILLLGLQFIVTLLSVHWPRLRNGITAEPVLLLANGSIQYETLRRQRLTESELRQAVRMSGAGDLAQVKAVVLESNGKFSVIPASQYGDGSAVDDVPGAEQL
jgi:uncharacterized membrane protein YcaP (DUF421 family)